MRQGKKESRGWFGVVQGIFRAVGVAALDVLHATFSWSWSTMRHMWGDTGEHPSRRKGSHRIGR